MMTVRNRVNMRAVYFILSLLLISCSKDDASETPGKFELQSISIGEKQDQSSFENVAPNASIVLTFTDAVDEAIKTEHLEMQEGSESMADRSNTRLNEEIESKIRQWDGTVFGASLKNMYENSTSYEGICEYADIDYEDYEEEMK